MGVMAAVHIDMVMNREVPESVIELIEDSMQISHDGLLYSAELDGNWNIEDVIDAMEPINSYVKSGTINYWSDLGEAIADFENGKWCEEWQETYYPSSLPTYSVSSTDRVKEILNIITDDLSCCSDRGHIAELLLKKCNLSDKEVRIYGLDWMKEFVMEGKK